jgi:hypothetical protein
LHGYFICGCEDPLIAAAKMEKSPITE